MYREREQRRRTPPEVALAEVPISVTRLAKYLAWADHAMGITVSVSRFEAGAERYWTKEMSEQHRGTWLAFAASLLGMLPKREMRPLFGRCSPTSDPIRLQGYLGRED